MSENKTKSQKSLILVKNSVFVQMIALSISSEDVKGIQVWTPRNKDAGFLLHPKNWCFQKHAFLHIFTFFFLEMYCFVIHDVQPFNRVLSFIIA